MTFLLDTNVVSDTMNARPRERVARWLDENLLRGLFISALTVGEVKFGADRLKPSPRREELQQAFELMKLDWEGRILPVTDKVAEEWGRLSALTRRTLPAIDSLIAATAIHHNLVLVTRNTRDFQFPGLEIFDPFA